MQNKYSKEIKVEELQRVGQKKFIREGWKDRLALHEKNGGLLAESMDHKQLFHGLNPETQRNGYDSIKHPSENVSKLVFDRLFVAAVASVTKELLLVNEKLKHLARKARDKVKKGLDELGKGKAAINAYAKHVR